MAVTFGLQKVKAAARTGVGTYSAAIIVPYAQMIGFTTRVISAEGPGDDGLAVVASRIIAGSGTARFLGVNYAFAALITGQSIVTEGMTPNVTRTLSIPKGARLPPFGLVGQGLNEEDLGEHVVFGPNLKITGDVTFGTMEYGTLSSLEFPFTAIDDGDFDILNYIERETTGDFTLPPSNLA